MKGSRTKRKPKPANQSNSSDQGPPPPKKSRKSAGKSTKPMCPQETSVDYFSRLPTEVIENILASMPMTSIVNFAHVSKTWLNLTSNWIARKSVTLRIVADLKQAFEEKDRKTLISACSNLGTLIRLLTIFKKREGGKTRLWWLKQTILAAKINSKSSDKTLKGLGAFVSGCFLSSDSQELDKVMKCLFGKLRTRTMINTQLRYLPGSRKHHEFATRNILRTLFTDYVLLVAALKFLSRKSSSYPQLAPSGLARLAFVLYGPMSKSFVKPNTIAWKLASRASPPERCMMPLGHFLSLSFWREDPFTAQDILNALLGDTAIGWTPAAIGDLFAVLDDQLSIPYLLENSTNSEILLAVGKISLERMDLLLSVLKERLAAAVFKKILVKMKSLISGEIESQHKICLDTCGNCDDCPVCPIKSFRAIAESIKEQMKRKLPPQSPPARRFSLRVAERSQNSSETVRSRCEAAKQRVSTNREKNSSK